jgi:hypothetical protein
MFQFGIQNIPSPIGKWVQKDGVQVKKPSMMGGPRGKGNPSRTKEKLFDVD